MTTKPHAPSCDRNKEPILEVLKKHIATDEKLRLFEIGSGTGQHAVYFAEYFKNLHWVTSDVPANHAGIKLWLNQAKLPNVEGPLIFDVDKNDLPKQVFNFVFTANTLHILSWKQDKTLFKMLGNRLREGAQVLIYGPFNYNGTFTSKSNEEFDRMLKEKDPKSGIRSFEDVNNAMTKNGFKFTADYEMPANNRLLVFTRLTLVKKTK